MATIHVKNIGPLADTGPLAVAPLTLVIGPQSSGKSTLLKLLCFCTWVEKHVMLDGDNFLYDFTHYNRFRRELMRFHRLDALFFSSESSLRYVGEAVSIELEGASGNARIQRRPHFAQARHNVKVCFLPAERNLLSALQNMERAYRSNSVDLLFNYVLEWGEARRRFTSDHPLSLPFDPNLSYYYDRQRGRDMLMLADRRKSLSTVYASSGVQSALPVVAMAAHVAQVLGSVGAYTPLDVQRCEAAGREAVEQLFRYRAFCLYVEEPEQNLFPASQYDLLLTLVGHLHRSSLAGEGRASVVMLTSHSPYVLTALNVLILAAQAAEHHRPEVEGIVPPECLLRPGDFAAYGINADHRVESLIDDVTGLVRGEWLDSVSERVDDIMNRLNLLLYGDHEG